MQSIIWKIEKNRNGANNLDGKQSKDVEVLLWNGIGLTENRNVEQQTDIFDFIK